MSFVPLTQAVSSGDAKAVSAVLANGADVNERTGGGQTPLILATIFGHTHLIPLLLEAGADPTLRDNLGLNAVDWAQRRGATEALELFSNKRVRAKAQAEVPRPQPRPTSVPLEERQTPKPVSEAERSRRWIAGLKQRIAEQPQQEIPDGTNIFRARQEPPSDAEPLPEPEPSPVPIKEPDTKPVPIREPDPKPEPQPKPEPEPQIDTSSYKSEEALQTVDALQPVDAPQPLDEPVPRPRSTRKRCPKCNAIYNSELVAYCAHHIVALVDADEAPIISEPPKPSPVLFWMLIVITLTGSVVIGSLIASYFYRTNKPTTQVAASTSAPAAVQKGTPALGPELEGKVVTLPIAECPLNGQEAIPGTVIVKITVDKNGQVKSARASGGDWLLRGAATEAAMKSTFSPEKLRGRDIEGTITYTFEP